MRFSHFLEKVDQKFFEARFSSKLFILAPKTPSENFGLIGPKQMPKNNTKEQNLPLVRGSTRRGGGPPPAKSFYTVLSKHIFPESSPILQLIKILQPFILQIADISNDIYQ